MSFTLPSGVRSDFDDLWRLLYERVAEIVRSSLTREFGAAWRGGKMDGAYVTPATVARLGAVRPDGTTIGVTPQGVISSLGGGFGGGSGTTTVTGDYIITAADSLVLVDAAAGDVTVTLLAAASMTHFLGIKRIDASTHTVTITPHAGETIDGASGAELDVQGHSYLLAPATSSVMIVAGFAPNPLTTKGDVAVADARGIPRRLGAGTDGQQLTSRSTAPLGEDYE
jgi:hypothetical protein